MRSANNIWPGELGSSSGELGYNVMDHHYNLGSPAVLWKDTMINIITAEDRAGFIFPVYHQFDKRITCGFGYRYGKPQRMEPQVAELAIGAELKDTYRIRVHGK